MKFSFVLVSFLGCLAVCRADAVRLQIVGPDEKPVAGAKVGVTETRSYGIGDKRETPFELQSDGAGTVAFQSKNSLAPPRNSWNTVELRAQVSAPGLALAKVELRAGDNTLTLGKGHTLGGGVLDETGKPVAGVTLVLYSLLTLGAPDDAFPKAVRFAGEQAPRTLSDANGKWSFEGMPAQGTTRIGVMDARFLKRSFDFDVSKNAAPIALERGATLKGRLLKPDGSGAGGVLVRAGASEATRPTDENGAFEIGGVHEGTQHLRAVGSNEAGLMQNLPFIVPGQVVGDLKRGETRDIGQWKAEAGVHIRGRVVSAGDHKPIESVGFGLWGSSFHTNSRSDKNGNFDFVALDDIETLAFYADDFLGGDQKHLPAPKNGVIAVGTVELKPRKPRSGQSVTGTVQTEAGLPLGMMFEVNKKGRRETLGFSKEDGTLSIDALEKGDYTLSTRRARIVSGAAFSVGQGAPKKLRVVIAGNNPRVVSTVEGRVVDEANRPVAGAIIGLNFRGAGGSRDDQTVISNPDGSYSAPFSMIEGVPAITSVSRSGFAVGAPTGVLTKVDGVWHGDIEMQRLGELRGRVVDSGGKAVVGAFVGLSRGSALPVATDERGEFILKDVPTRNVTLLASDGPRLASSVGKGEALQIALPDAAPVEDKSALADRILSGARIGFGNQDDWNALGTKRMVDVFLRSGGPSRMWDNNRRWNNFLRTLSERDPQLLLEREAELRERAPGGNRAEVGRLAMVARAGSKDEAGRALVKAWLHEQKAQRRELSPASVTQLLGVAEVAARFDPQSGAMWLDSALQIAAQLEPGSSDILHEWGVLAARTAPDAPQKLIAGWPPAPAARLLEESLGVFAERGDAPAARKAFALMEQLTAKARSAPGKAKTSDSILSPKQLLDSGRERLALALAPTEPGAALEVALQLDEWRRGKDLLIVARDAIKANQPGIARRALNAVFDARLDISDEAQAAIVARTFDAALADDLLARTLAASQHDLSFRDYARARARTAPGQSRIFLEREWARAVKQPQKPLTDYLDHYADFRADLSSAMAWVAPARALEMVEQVPEKDDLRLHTRADIAQGLLSGE
jgi:hypothetical protein